MTWFTIQNGKVAGISKSNNPRDAPPGAIQVPDDHGGFPGDKVSWFTKDWHRVPDELLVKQGVRKDRRGVWFSTKKKGDSKTIYVLDEEPGDDFTRENPGEYDVWDSVQKTWVQDNRAKESSDSERELAVIDGTLDTLERKILRSLLAKQAGTATVEDEQYFNEYYTAITKAQAERKSLLDTLNRA